MISITHKYPEYQADMDRMLSGIHQLAVTPNRLHLTVWSSAGEKTDPVYPSDTDYAVAVVTARGFRIDPFYYEAEFADNGVQTQRSQRIVYTPLSDMEIMQRHFGPMPINKAMMEWRKLVSHPVETIHFGIVQLDYPVLHVTIEQAAQKQARTNWILSIEQSQRWESLIRQFAAEVEIRGW